MSTVKSGSVPWIRSVWGSKTKMLVITRNLKSKSCLSSDLHQCKGVLCFSLNLQTKSTPHPFFFFLLLQHKPVSVFKGMIPVLFLPFTRDYLKQQCWQFDMVFTFVLFCTKQQHLGGGEAKWYGAPFMQRCIKKELSSQRAGAASAQLDTNLKLPLKN